MAKFLINTWIMLVFSLFFILVISLGLLFFGIHPNFNQMYTQVTGFVCRNWVQISLILSELAALLPGPWNGIAQSVLRALSSRKRQNNSNH